MDRPLIRMQTKTAGPLRAGEATLMLQSRALELHFPWVGLVWNRPVAVSVTQNGRRQQVPIPDPTLKLMVGLAAINLLALVATVAVRLRR